MLERAYLSVSNGKLSDGPLVAGVVLDQLLETLGRGRRLAVAQVEVSRLVPHVVQTTVCQLQRNTPFSRVAVNLPLSSLSRLLCHRYFVTSMLFLAHWSLLLFT